MKAKILLLFTVLFSIALLNTCKKEESKPKITKEKISGYVQKGPFINGTSINLSELDDSLNQTGNIFTTQIIDNEGTFEINKIQLYSKYVEFKADGYYFDEIKGEKSVAPLTLYALSDITNKSSINVNILTHLEKDRVKYLVNNGLSFKQAKDSAQKEILRIFWIKKDTMVNSEDLNISVNNEDNAILLAISIILQGNRSVGDLTELLANINTDIREDGVLNNQTTRTLIFNAVQTLNLDTIRKNLENRYKELGVDANIPNFEKYIPEKISIKESITYPDESIGREGAIEITVTGGTPPYSFLWSTGDITKNINNISIGRYTITVTDANYNHISQEFKIHSFCYDIEGNIYKTVRIGDQIWMAENLKTTKYKDGTKIPLATTSESDSIKWIYLSSEAYYWYNNDSATYSPYGALYNWHTVNTGKLCPAGWHVPTYTELETLINYLGGWYGAAPKLKETGTTHWLTDFTATTNETGFTALPGGLLSSDGFHEIGQEGWWWTSTESNNINNFSYFFRMQSYDRGVYSVDIPKDYGLSVRCLKD